MKLLACIALLCALFTGLEKADAQDLSECQAAAKLAYMLTIGVTEGYALETQQVNFPKSPPEAQEGNQKWVTMIKGQIAPLLPPILPEANSEAAKTLANNIGRKLAEDCAYALGALRKIKSQHIGSVEAKGERCQEHLTDEIFIVRSLMNGASFEELRMLARNSSRPLGEERLAKVLKLLDEAEKTSDIRDWLVKKWNACMGTAT